MFADSNMLKCDALVFGGEEKGELEYEPWGIYLNDWLLFPSPFPPLCRKRRESTFDMEEFLFISKTWWDEINYSRGIIDFGFEALEKCLSQFGENFYCLMEGKLVENDKKRLRCGKKWDSNSLIRF